MSITAAPLVAVVGTGLSPSRGASFNNWGRKKHRTSSSSSSCFPISSPDASIDQTSNHVMPFKQTASFNNNVTSLCGQYPLVHHGVIASLLESAANDYSKASCLIRQVSESGLHNNSHHIRTPVSASFVSFRSKRPRDWNSSDVSMDDEEEGSRGISDEDFHRGECKDADENHRKITQLHNTSTAATVNKNTAGLLNNVMELPTVPQFQPENNNQFHNQLPSSSPVINLASSDSYVDAIMNLGSPTDSSSCIVSSPVLSTPARTTTCESQNVQGLKHTIQVLSRVVLKQSDRMSSLQNEKRRLIEENLQLKSSMSITAEELRQCRDTNQILQFYLSSNRATTEFMGSNSNGDGHDGCNGFNFLGSNRMPDIC